MLHHSFVVVSKCRLQIRILFQIKLHIKVRSTLSAFCDTMIEPMLYISIPVISKGCFQIRIVFPIKHHIQHRTNQSAFLQTKMLHMVIRISFGICLLYILISICIKFRTENICHTGCGSIQLHCHHSYNRQYCNPFLFHKHLLLTDFLLLYRKLTEYSISRWNYLESKREHLSTLSSLFIMKINHLKNLCNYVPASVIQAASQSPE